MIISFILLQLYGVGCNDFGMIAAPTIGEDYPTPYNIKELNSEYIYLFMC